MPGNEAGHAVIADNWLLKARQDFILAGFTVYPWSAVAHQEYCFYQFWFVVPFLAEIAHQSPYRTGVLFLPVLA